MAFIPTPGAVRTDIKFLNGNQEMHNIIWSARETDWTQAEREALNTAIKDWWHNSARQYFAPGMVLYQITTVNQESANAPGSTLVVSPPDPGTNGTVTVPNNVAACMTLRTALRGRSYRGRMYLGGLENASLANQTTFNLGTITSLITALTALKDAITALGAIWVVVSKWLNKVPRSAGVKTPISAVAGDTLIDSQRRRLAGRGV